MPRLEVVNPRDHPNCTQCGSAFAKVCDGTAKCCSSCGEELVGDCVSMNQDFYHIHCFDTMVAPSLVCLVCGEAVAADYHSTSEGRVHRDCWQAYLDSKVQACLVCCKPVLNQYYERAGGIVHAEGTCLSTHDASVGRGSEAGGEPGPELVVRQTVAINELYEVGENLGQGGFAQVRKGVDRVDGSVWALKMIPMSLYKRHEAQTLREVEIQANMRHVGIVAIREVVITRRYFVLVMELLSGGELLDRLVAKERYAEADCKQIALALFQVVKHLHDHDIVHRDIKPENLLFETTEANSPLKLSDFGFATVAGHDKMTTRCGTPEYVAPEIIQQQPYDNKVDMWSCGVLLYLLLGGYPPFYHEEREEMFELVCHGRVVFHEEIWEHVSDQAKSLIRLLLQRDPKSRLSATEALNHPWFHRAQVEIDKETEEKVKRKQKGKELVKSLQQLKRYNATKRLKRAVYVVIAAHRAQAFAEQYDKHRLVKS